MVDHIRPEVEHFADNAVNPIPASFLSFCSKPTSAADGENFLCEKMSKREFLTRKEKCFSWQVLSRLLLGNILLLVEYDWGEIRGWGDEDTKAHISLSLSLLYLCLCICFVCFKCVCEYVRICACVYVCVCACGRLWAVVRLFQYLLSYHAVLDHSTQVYFSFAISFSPSLSLSLSLALSHSLSLSWWERLHSQSRLRASSLSPLYFKMMYCDIVVVVRMEYILHLLS